MRNRKLLLLWAICVMPQKDIWSNVNPPTLVGVVKEMQMKKREIDLVKGPHVSWTDATAIFSQFGGDIDIEEIKAGDEIEVWTPDCRIGRKAKTIKSMVIRVHK